MPAIAVTMGTNTSSFHFLNLSEPFTHLIGANPTASAGYLSVEEQEGVGKAQTEPEYARQQQI